MLRDVNITVSDGLLSAGGTPGEGIHLKIGSSPVESNELIKITGSYDVKRVLLKLKNCPLADAVMDSLENGSDTIYCMPVKASVEGSVKAVEKTGKGEGTLVVNGKPNNDYSLIAKIIEPGGLNEATFSWSVNGGITMSDEIMVPLDGNLTLDGTGLTIKFTEGASKPTSFLAGDTFTAKANAPVMSNADILGAIDKIRNLKEAFEFTHIVGATEKATWAAVAEKQVELEKVHKTPMMFILEAYEPEENQTAYDYSEALQKDRKVVGNTDIQIVAARVLYKCMDGAIRERNGAGIVCGLYARSKPQQSISETKSFALMEKKVLGLLPAGIEDEVEFLDTAGYLTLRRYIGLEGYYVTTPRMGCPEGSDYKYAEHTRIKNKIIRKIRKEALGQLHTEIDLSDVDGSLKVLAQIIGSPIDQMAREKEISQGRIIIPPGQDLLTTEKVALIARFTPKGYAREFEIDLGMEAI